jgi:lycopene cyclase domain-containing protein
VSYTNLAVIAVVTAAVLDLVILRTKVLRSKTFWVSWAIIVPFQLLTNGLFTGSRIVRYDGAAIIGNTTPEVGRPEFLGAGRIAYAPVEDLMFGFALIVLSISVWVLLGRSGVQPTPRSGPPRRWIRSGPLGLD